MDSLSEFEQYLPIVMDRMNSLEEFHRWLELQPHILSVTLEDYWIKTNPPQREFVVEFGGDRTSTVTRIIDVYVLGDGQIRFSECRES